MWGRTQTKNTKAKISKANKGRKFSSLVNIAKGRKKEENGFFGKTHSIETKKNLSILAGKRVGLNGQATVKKVYTFNNSVYGEVKLTPLELCQKFNLDRSSITKLINGKRNVHKGWRLNNDGI